MRDLSGPDGFSEANALDVSGRMFGVFGAEEGMAFETQRTGHVKLTSYGLDVKRWNICMKTCP